MILIHKKEIIEIAPYFLSRRRRSIDLDLFTLRKNRKISRQRPQLDLRGQRQLGLDPCGLLRQFSLAENDLASLRRDHHADSGHDHGERELRQIEINQYIFQHQRLVIGDPSLIHKIRNPSVFSQIKHSPCRKLQIRDADDSDINAQDGGEQESNICTDRDNNRVFGGEIPAGKDDGNHHQKRHILIIDRVDHHKRNDQADHQHVFDPCFLTSKPQGNDSRNA